MSEFLDNLRADLQGRIAELEGAAREHDELAGALDALEGRAPASAPQTSRSAGRPGRPRGTGRRASEALEVIKAHPGLRTSQIAERMGIQVNYLYRLLPDLERAGSVQKMSGGWYTARPTEATESAA